MSLELKPEGHDIFLNNLVAEVLSKYKTIELKTAVFQLNVAPIHLSLTFVMQSSKMSRNSQILIWRYSQTRQIISLFFIVFAITQNTISREPNTHLHGVFTKLKLKYSNRKCQKQKQNFSTSDSFYLIASHFFILKVFTRQLKKHSTCFFSSSSFFAQITVNKMEGKIISNLHS